MQFGDDEDVQAPPGKVNWPMWGVVIAVMAVGWAMAIGGAFVLRPYLMVLTSN